MFTTEFEAEEFFCTGDARRCPRHPGVKTSSDDGMFDAPCDVCEGEMHEEYMWEDAYENALAAGFVGSLNEFKAQEAIQVTAERSAQEAEVLARTADDDILF